MSQLVYNDEEKKLIEAVHAVFPKVELDPEVAIGALDTGGEVFYRKTMGWLEPLEFEAFFRGIYEGELIRLWESDNTVFWPSKFKPIPWWEVKFEDIRELRGIIDGMVWMSPYGRHYYLPFFILAAIQDMSLNRQHLVTDYNECFIENDLLVCLTPPVELAGKDCWAEAMKIDPVYKNPQFKQFLYTMRQSLRFLIFISFFNEGQKKLISEFVEFLAKKPHEITYALSFFEFEEEKVDRLKSCWSFC